MLPAFQNQPENPVTDNLGSSSQAVVVKDPAMPVLSETCVCRSFEENRSGHKSLVYQEIPPRPNLDFDARDNLPISPATISILIVPSKCENPADNRSDLKSKLYYSFLINHFFIDKFISSNLMVTLPSLLPLYIKPDSFDVAESDLNTFNLLFISGYTAGLLVGGLIAPFFVALVKPSYARFLLRIFMVAGLMLTLINDRRLFIAIRILMGVCIGIVQPYDIGEAIKLSPASHKFRTATIDELYFSLGASVGTFGSYLANSGIITWQSIHLVLAGSLAATLVVSVVYVGIDHSFSQDLRSGNETAAVAKLSRVFREDLVAQAIQEEKEFIALSKKADSLWQAFLANRKELYYAILVVFVGSLSFAENYTSYLMNFVADDLNNPKETQRGSLFITLGAICELIMKIILIIFPNLIRRRKLASGIGLTLFSVIWFIHMIFYLKDYWAGCGPLLVVWFAIAGALYFPVVWSHLSDVLSGELLGIVLSVSRIFDIGTQNYFSFIFPKEKDRSTYWVACMIFGIASAIGTLLVWFFFFETGGMTKVEIHQHLNKKELKSSDTQPTITP